MLIATPTIKGIVIMDINVVTETKPTERSTSLPYFAANIESMAATGAEAEAVSATAITGSNPNPRINVIEARTMDGITNSLKMDAISAGVQRK
jgi:hypothetical protein